MERVFVRNIRKLKSLKSKIEEAFNIHLKITGTDIEISGSDEDGYSEYLASKALEAIDMGLSPDTALQLKNEEWMFEKIDIKDSVKQSRVTAVKGRIIGKDGKAKRSLENLTGCEIEVQGHYLGILGRASDVVVAINAITKLIQGSPHSKVYAYLERNQEPRQLREDEEDSLTED